MRLTTPFAKMVQKAASAGLKKTDRPRSMETLAELCGMSRQHLYNLMVGACEAPEWTVVRIAAALGVSEDAAGKALRATHKAWEAAR